MNLPEKLLKNQITIKIKTSGGSMRPFVYSGDEVIIKPASSNELSAGNIIAYRRKNNDNNIICHRLLEKRNSILIVKGDAFIQCHEKIHPNLLLGKVIAIERGAKIINLETNFQKKLGSKIAWISMNLPLLLLILGYFDTAVKSPHLIPVKIFNRVKLSLQSNNQFKRKKQQPNH